MSEPIKPSKSGKYLTSQEWDALKAFGYSQEELLADQPFGPMIASYSRAQAIADGVLVDITELAKRAGFRLHTVMTCGVAAALLELIRRRRPGDFQQYGEEVIRRSAALAMLQTLYAAIRRGGPGRDRVHFQCGSLKLWSLVGPGDQAEPVLTIMLEGED